MTRRQWLDAATAQIRFSPDRERVRRELAAHWDDTEDAARARGLTREEAEAEALANLGDPRAIAPELGRLHSPWLGRIWWTVRAVTAVVLVLLILSALDPMFRHHLRSQADPLEIPSEFRESDELTIVRTGLWEDLDLGEAGGYHFTVPAAYAQTLTVPGENGYEVLLLGLRLEASTWRFWEPWQADPDCMAVTDSSGCTYLPSSDPRSMEPLMPYFYTSGTDGYADLYVQNMPATPEWLDVTLGDAVLHIELEGGGGS